MGINVGGNVGGDVSGRDKKVKEPKEEKTGFAKKVSIIVGAILSLLGLLFANWDKIF